MPSCGRLRLVVLPFWSSRCSVPSTLGGVPVFIRAGSESRDEDELLCDAFCGPFAGAAACKLLQAEVDLALEEGARGQDGGVARKC